MPENGDAKAPPMARSPAANLRAFGVDRCSGRPDLRRQVAEVVHQLARAIARTRPWRGPRRRRSDARPIGGGGGSGGRSGTGASRHHDADLTRTRRPCACGARRRGTRRHRVDALPAQAHALVRAAAGVRSVTSVRYSPSPPRRRSSGFAQVAPPSCDQLRNTAGSGDRRATSMPDREIEIDRRQRTLAGISLAGPLSQRAISGAP